MFSQVDHSPKKMKKKFFDSMIKMYFVMEIAVLLTQPVLAMTLKEFFDSFNEDFEFDYLQQIATRLRICSYG